MIEIPTIDSKICHPDRVWKDLLDEFLAGPPAIELSMIGEGPCLTTIGLYDILDIFCERFSYPKKNVKIVTANMLEHHNGYSIVREHQKYELQAVKAMPKISHAKIFDQDFKYFGNFIGHANKYRLQTASLLWNNFRHKTLQTFHCKMTEDYHREFLGIEDLMHSGASLEEIRGALDLIVAAPLTLDEITSYPILIPANLNILKVYPNFFVEVVNLTYFSGNVFYVDEKVWRPIAMRTPFIVQGPKDTIKNLRRLGFKTFDRWWDEGYSEDVEDCQMSGIEEVITALSALDLDQVRKMYDDMQTTLEHNYEHLMNLKDNDFLALCQN